MNVYNRVVLFQAWILVLCSVGGYFLADTPEIGLVALVYNTFLFTAVVAWTDRHDRECPLLEVDR